MRFPSLMSLDFLVAVCFILLILNSLGYLYMDYFGEMMFTRHMVGHYMSLLVLVITGVIIYDNKILSRLQICLTL